MQGEISVEFNGRLEIDAGVQVHRRSDQGNRISNPLFVANFIHAVYTQRPHGHQATRFGRDGHADACSR